MIDNNNKTFLVFSFDYHAKWYIVTLKKFLEREKQGGKAV